MPASRPSRERDPNALWGRYRRTADPALRDRLVLTYAPLVKHIAYRKLRELPAEVEAEDLISCGLEALVQAVDRYDPRKGATLEQYAWTRIHGAILDELRRLDWAPRSVRRWQRDIERVVEEFTAIHGRPPRPGEVADALGVSREELRRRQHEIGRSSLTSLNIPVLTEDDASIERMDTLVDDDQCNDPLGALAGRDAKERFRAAFAGLPEREQHVAVLLYVKGLTLGEAGQVLGVSESRVCQLHAGLKRRLRDALRADEALFAAAA